MKIEVGKYYIVDERAYNRRYRVKVTRLYDGNDGKFYGNFSQFCTKTRKYIKNFEEGLFGECYGGAVIKPCRKGSKRERYAK